MFKSNSLKALAIVMAIFATGCASNKATDGEEENRNAARNRGAIGGALIAVTAGALTGSPEVAEKAGTMGAVAGGVSGSMKDTAEARETERTEILAESLDKDTRSESEKRVAELEAEIRIKELEQQIAEMEQQEQATDSENDQTTTKLESQQESDRS